MGSSGLGRWVGLAFVASGALIVAKGVVNIVSDADPGLVPPATLLFALGMVGLHARLGGRGGPPGKVGVVLAWVALVASGVNVIGLAFSVPAPASPSAPVLLEITYMAAFLGVLIGLLALGIAALAAEVPSPPRRAVPLAVGLLWFPLQGVGFAIHDGLGLVLGGLAWTLLGYVLWSASATPARRTSRVS